MNVMFVESREIVKSITCSLTQDVVLISTAKKNVFKELKTVLFLQKRNVNGARSWVINLVKCFTNLCKNILLMKMVYLHFITVWMNILKKHKLLNLNVWKEVWRTVSRKFHKQWKTDLLNLKVNLMKKTLIVW